MPRWVRLAATGGKLLYYRRANGPSFIECFCLSCAQRDLVRVDRRPGYTLVLIHVDVAEITVKDFLSRLFGVSNKRGCDLHIWGKVFVIMKKKTFGLHDKLGTFSFRGVVILVIISS